jgi:tryptophan-rich sensory protein
MVRLQRHLDRRWVFGSSGLAGCETSSVHVARFDSSDHVARIGSDRRRRGRLAVTVASVVTAAIAGNAVIGRDSLEWFRELRRPVGMPSMPVFATVGVGYYAAMGTVLYRGQQRGDRTATTLAVVVLGLNELWNVAFFGRRSPRNGFLGILLFAFPVVALRRRVRDDNLSRRLLDGYAIWLAYDAWWTHRLWHLNRHPDG